MNLHHDVRIPPGVSALAERLLPFVEGARPDNSPSKCLDTYDLVEIEWAGERAVGQRWSRLV